MNSRLRELKVTAEIYGRLSYAAIVEIYAEIYRLERRNKVLRTRLSIENDTGAKDD